MLTLQHIVEELEGSYGNRFQASQRHILSALDQAQKTAFNHDCRAFERTAELEPNHEGYFMFPEDAREIISIENSGRNRSYRIDTLRRRVLFSNGTVFPSSFPPVARYYLRPETLTFTEEIAAENSNDNVLIFTQEDEAKVIVPDEWRWAVLAQPAIAMLDTNLYGDQSPQAYLESYYREFWEAMNARPQNRKPDASIGAW